MALDQSILEDISFDLSALTERYPEAELKEALVRQIFCIMDNPENHQDMAVMGSYFLSEANYHLDKSKGKSLKAVGDK